MPREPIRTKSSEIDPWLTVSSGINDILNCKQSDLSLSTLHNSVSHLVSIGQLDQLRNGLVDVMKRHFDGWTKELSQLAGNLLIVRFSNIYQDFENYCRIIPKFYMLYDRKFDNSNDRSEILIRKLFVDCVLKDKKLVKDTSIGMRKEIATARSRVDVDLGRVRKLLEMYYSFREIEGRVFDQFFEDFQEDTTQYYDDFYKTKFEGNSFHAYLQCCSEQFEHEETMAKDILKPEQVESVLQILHQCLLSSREEVFTGGEEPPVSIALTAQDSRPIKWLVDMYTRFRTPLDVVFKTCAQHVGAQMEKLKPNFHEKMKAQEISRHVRELIELVQNLSQSYNLVFGKFHKAVEELDNQIMKMWNDSQFDIVNNFSAYIDIQIKTEFKSFSPEERETFPAMVAKFYSYIQEKKAFAMTYDLGLFRRFVKMQLKLCDLERPIIEAVRKAKAPDFAARFDQYIKKIKESQAVEGEFRQQMPDLVSDGAKRKIAFAPLIFDSQTFPLHRREARAIPADCRKVHEAFVKWYKQKHPKIELTLLADISVVESKFHVPKNTRSPTAHTYSVSSDLLCASIMDVLSKGKKTCAELIQETEGEAKLVKECLVRLLRNACPVLKRTATGENGKKLGDLDIFELNPQFFFNSSRVTFPPIVSEKKVDRKNLNERVEEARIFAVKAAAVRVLKAKRKVAQSVLEEEVIRDVRQWYRVEPALIRHQLTDLEADDYLERNVENGVQVLIYKQS